MKLLRVAGATLNQTPLDWEGNRERIQQLITKAKADGIALLCLPELAISGYGCEDFFLSITTTRTAEAVLAELLPATTDITVLIGLPVYLEGSVYNGAAMVQNGRILGVNLKKMLPRDGVHYEQRWFRPWADRRVTELVLCGQQVAAGDLWYQLGDIGVGVEICEEAWGSRPGAAAFAENLDVVLNCSASHFALGKYQVRERLVANSSRSMQVHYVYANLVGNEAGRVVYDGGVLIAENGQIVARGRRFGFSDGELTTYDLNIDLARVAKMRLRSARDEQANNLSKEHPTGKLPVRGGALGAAVRSGTTPATLKNLSPLPWAPNESSKTTPEEEFLAVEVLGLFDYLRKARAKGFVVSLSGGCDSACCAVLVGHMVAMALAELGPDQFATRLGIDQTTIAQIQSAKRSSPGAWINALLLCVYQRTNNSSTATEESARSVAQSIGAAFYSLDVQPAIDFYESVSAQVFGRNLNWEQDDLTRQNIQARARAPLAWLLANIKGFLLITTSNRSEAAVGYATMDGDTAGGLAPLGGIDKPFLRRWLQWAASQSQLGLGALPDLKAVAELKPTAELRPQVEAQTDEADLMPYVVLERIERLLIRDKLHPIDILGFLRKEFGEYDDVQLRGWLDRFLVLWSQSQWKRERLAPSFHIDDESLDPRTWCRFPIFSGSFQRERGELR